MSSRSRRNRMIQRPGIQAPEDGTPISAPEVDSVDELEDRELGDQEESDEAGEEDETAIAESPTAPAPIVPPRRASPPATMSSGSKADRIARARALPADRSHWTSAWEAGRYAAMAAFQRGTAITAIAKLQPTDGRAGCRDCWTRGRDAALRALSG